MEVPWSRYGMMPEAVWMPNMGTFHPHSKFHRPSITRLEMCLQYKSDIVTEEDTEQRPPPANITLLDKCDDHLPRRHCCCCCCAGLLLLVSNWRADDNFATMGSVPLSAFSWCVDRVQVRYRGDRPRTRPAYRGPNEAVSTRQWQSTSLRRACTKCNLQLHARSRFIRP